MVLETSTTRIISAIKDMKKLEAFSDRKVAKEKANRQADAGRKKFWASNCLWAGTHGSKPERWLDAAFSETNN